MKKTCPYSNDKLVNVALKLGQRISNVKLYPYQIPFSKRIIESVLKEDVATITGLFSRQCLDPNQLCMTPQGPVYLKDLQEVETLDVLHTKTTKVLSKTKAVERPTYKLTIHNGISILAGQYHLFKDSFNKWKYTEEFEGEIQCSLKFLKRGNDAVGFYASQVLLHKRTPAAIDKELGTDILTVHITPEMEKALPDKLRFVRDYSHLTCRVDLNVDRSKKLVAKAFESSYETIKWMMGLATLDMFRNNRKRVPRITLPFGSNGYFYDSLIFFLNKHGFAPTVTNKRTLVFTSYEDISRLFEFFENDPFYGEVREFVNLYYSRTGYRFSPFSTVKLLRKYPEAKANIKPSLLSHYRKKGVLMGTFLHLLRKSGVHETEVEFPSLLFAPVKSVSQTHTIPLMDIETETETYDAGIYHTHNCGKTEAVSVICNGLMAILPHLHQMFPDDKRFQKFKDGIWIGIFAPSKDQAKTTFDRVRDRISNKYGMAILREFNLDLSVSRGDTVRLTNNSLCRCLTASETSQIESKTYHLIIIEEAQDVSPRKIRKSIRPMGAAVAATLVMVGTANEKISDLYSNIKYNRTVFSRTGVHNHFQVNWREAAKYNPKYELYVKAEMDRLGPDSDEFRMSYENEFILQRGMAFTEFHLSDRTPENPVGMYIPKLGLCPIYRGSNPVVVGIDVGKARDSSVLTALEVDESSGVELPNGMAYNKILLNWLEMVGDNFTEQYKRMIDFIQKVRADTVVVDTSGKGDVVYDFLEAVFPRLDFIPFTTTSKSKDKLCRHSQFEFNSGRILVPANKAARSTREWRRFNFQNETLIKDYNAQGYLRFHKPKDKIDGQEPHDDYSDSLFLALWGAKTDDIYEAEEMDNPFLATGPNLFLRGR